MSNLNIPTISEGSFSFRIRALKTLHEGFLEIRIEYKWDYEKDFSILTDTVPIDRFITDEDFSKYFLDSIISKAKQEAWDKMKRRTKL